MTVCNACRYCEGLCAVFPAMEMRRIFPDGDLNYLANLCHNCGACYYDCQFSPPHEFDVNVPRVLAKVRADSYARHAWPRFMASTFARNGLVIALAAALGVAGFLIGFVVSTDPALLFAAHRGPGAFYRLMPHTAMALLFGLVFLYAVVAIGVAIGTFWRAIGPPLPAAGGLSPVVQATLDAGRLRYLDGGGAGCMNESMRAESRRKLHHHLTFYGFLLCFAATSVATLYHYVLQREAPYPWWDVPVIFGTLGGIGLVVGPLGLLLAKRRRDPALIEQDSHGMDTAFILMLLLTSVTGLGLLLFRSTPAMGMLLALHLGFVFAFFLTLPYSKFVHGIYRYVALLRCARERRQIMPPIKEK